MRPIGVTKLMGDYHNDRGPGWLAVLLISTVMSCAVVAAFQWASLNGHLPPVLSVPSQVAPAPAPPKATSIKVPKLVGLPMAVAGELLAARGLRLVVSDRREHESLPADAVVTQDPLPDSVLPEDSAVNVSVSTGAQADVAVPDVSGKTVEEAKTMLEGAGLTVAPLAESDPKDGVIERSEPQAAAVAARGSAVKLVLQSKTAEVPKVTGMSFGKAKKVLEDAGFKVGKVRQGADDYLDPGIILRQTPQAGAHLAPGGSVDLVKND